MPRHLRLVPRYDSAEAPPPTSVPAMPQPWEPRGTRPAIVLYVVLYVLVGVAACAVGFFATFIVERLESHAHRLQGKDVPLSDLPVRRP